MAQLPPGWCPRLHAAAAALDIGFPPPRREPVVEAGAFDEWRAGKRKIKVPGLESVTVQICYVDASGEASCRRITIRGLFENKGATYLDAYCHEREAARTFRIDRIEEIIDLATGEVDYDCAAWLERFGIVLDLPIPQPAPSPPQPPGVFIAYPNPQPAPPRSDRAVQVAWWKVEHGAALLMFAARYDGHAAPEEEAVIDDWIRHRLTKGSTSLCTDATVETCQRRARGVFPSIEDMEAAVFTLMQGFSDRQRRSLLEHLDRLIMIDGVIEPKEAEFRDALAETMATNEAAAAARRNLDRLIETAIPDTAPM